LGGIVAQQLLLAVAHISEMEPDVVRVAKTSVLGAFHFETLDRFLVRLGLGESTSGDNQTNDRNQ
jgi:hypothetical protein